MRNKPNNKLAHAALLAEFEARRARTRAVRPEPPTLLVKAQTMLREADTKEHFEQVRALLRLPECF